MGKGDKRRPAQVTRDEYDQKYQDAFGPTGPIRTIMSDDDRMQARADKEKLSKDIEKKEGSND